jgi:transposase
MPFDGHNPHSILVMDNCAIHHVSRTVKMIYKTGPLVHFLPPYYPDYNPIESLFSKVKC